ncbi:hypothetical protein [Paraburkholderia sp. BCC1884]|uniref:hypothetical protein n=1 Tax=Paraburkholderia sp. BCC1884 TaxID=2562668 RepID=UPI0011841DE5|nr:hypothetical protein [Paraburkholderia sp. BCC1884]
MKYLIRTLVTSVFAVALSTVTTFAQAGGSAAPSLGAGTTKTPSAAGDRATDVPDAGVGVGNGTDAAISGATTRRPSSKTNGLNKGTNSGANSDVNHGLNGSNRNIQ